MSQQFVRDPGLKLSEPLAPFSWVYEEMGANSFVRETTRSLHLQDAAMTRGAVALNGWLDRRHAGITATVETLQQMNECTKPEEAMLLQRKLLAGHCDRWSRDITAMTEGFFAAYQRGIFALHATMTGALPSLTAARSKPEVEAGIELVVSRAGDETVVERKAGPTPAKGTAELSKA